MSQRIRLQLALSLNAVGCVCLSQVVVIVVVIVVVTVVVVVVSLTTVAVVSLVCVLVNGLWSIQSVEKLIAAHYICNNSVCGERGGREVWGGRVGSGELNMHTQQEKYEYFR